MLIGRDGALALPPIPELRSDQRVVEFFNRCLAALLLAGVYVEAVTLDHLEFGSVIDWKYIRVETQGRAAANRFHFLYNATTELLQAALPGRELALHRLDLADHALSDPFRPAEPRPLDPQYWMPIPKLPGEEELEREEARVRESSGRR